MFNKYFLILCMGFNIMLLGGCAGPTEFGPKGGLIVPCPENDSLIKDQQLHIFSETGMQGTLSLYCYSPKSSLPLLAFFGVYLKALLYSRDDNGSCQYIGVSQLDITRQFSISAEKLLLLSVTKSGDKDLIEPEPANPEPANPEPANPEPANPEPANPEPAKPAPATQAPATQAPATQAPAKTKSNQRDQYKETKKTEAAKPLSPLARLRNAYAGALINIGEYNCRSFLASAFSTRALSSTQRDFMSTVGTGLSTGTALPNPTFSAAVGLTNLVYGSGIDSLNKNVYLDKTTEALANAIQASRIANRNYIFNNLEKEYGQYPIENLLSDIKAYENLCTVSSGAAELNRIAAQKLGAAENTDPGAAVTSILQALQKAQTDLVTEYNRKMDDAEQTKKDLEKQLEIYKSKLAKASIAQKQEYQKEIVNLNEKINKVVDALERDRKQLADRSKIINETVTSTIRAGNEVKDAPLPIGASTNLIPSTGAANGVK